MTAAVETMAYRFADSKDTPWHGLGTSISRNEEISSHEFQQRAGANWPVLKHALYYRSMDGKERTSTRFALVRGDTGQELSVVSKQYQPIQNVVVFEFFECDHALGFESSVDHYKVLVHTHDFGGNDFADTHFFTREAFLK